MLLNQPRLPAVPHSSPSNETKISRVFFSPRPSFFSFAKWESSVITTETPDRLSPAPTEYSPSFISKAMKEAMDEARERRSSSAMEREGRLKPQNTPLISSDTTANADAATASAKDAGWR